MADYGYDWTGRKKGEGFFGPLLHESGNTATELSVDVEFDGQKLNIPTLVPTLTENEVKHLLAGKPPTDSIMNKAIHHAIGRRKAGKSPFAQPGESPFMVWDF